MLTNDTNLVERIHAHFKSGEIAKWSPEFLNNKNIPEACKEFLIDVGLPSTSALQLGPDKQPSSRSRRGKTEQSKLNSNHFCIGFFNNTPLCLNGEGAVIANSLSHGEIFISSSIQAFIDSILVYIEMRGTDQDLSFEQLHNISKAVENRIREIDPSAFAKSENWWPQFVEHINCGQDYI